MSLPKYYEFVNTVKIISGSKALENIPFELEQRGAKRPMLLSDKVLLDIGTVAKIKNAFPKGGIQFVTMFTEIPPDSSVKIINAIATIYKENKCDSIVAVGGGSVIDTAKGLKLVLCQEVDDIMDLMGFNSLVPPKQKIPFIVIPTTSGTGSEATQVAVIANPDKGIKMEFIASEILPDVAVLDVRMTETLPPRVTASTGMDALSHAVEAYSNLQRNPVSSAFATAAIKMIVENIVEAVTNGTNKDARLAMANGSLLAGAAFSNSMVGNVHAIGHALGGVCHVPHGDAMCILLPHCMKYNIKQCGNYYAELLLPLAGAEVYANTLKEERALKAIQTIIDLQNLLNSKCGLATKIRDTRAEKEQLEDVVPKAMNDGAMVVNPRIMTPEDVLELLNQAW